MKTKRFLCMMLCALFLASLSLPAVEAAETKDYTIPPIPEFVSGDVDGSGKVEAVDARLALRMAVGLDPALCISSYWSFADMTGDGKVTAADARAILRVSVGLDAYHPIPADLGIWRIRSSFNLDSDRLGALGALQLNRDLDTGYRKEDLPAWRIDSVQTLSRWTSAFSKEDWSIRLNDAAGTGLPNDVKVLAFANRYDAAFFETHDLFICYMEEGSGSFSQAVYPPTQKDGVLTLSLSTLYFKNAVHTDDMAYWFIFIPVAKSVTASCASFACKRLPTLLLER